MAMSDDERPEQRRSTSVLVMICAAAGAVLGLAASDNGWL